MMGAQSGVQEHPDASPVLATHKLRRWCKHWTLLHCYLESETRRESLTGKFIHRRTLVLESKCRKRFLGRARWQPPAASRGAEGSERRTGTSISTAWNPDGKGYGIVKGAGCVRVHRCVPTCSTHINGGRQWKSVKSRLWYKEALVLCCCCLVAHLGRILRDPVNCSLPSSSVHEISQARILEGVAISSSSGSSQLRDQTHISYGSCFPGCSVVNNPSASVGDMGSIPGLGRSPGGGNGNPLQYSCLGNPMDGGA